MIRVGAERIADFDDEPTQVIRRPDGRPVRDSAAPPRKCKSCNGTLSRLLHNVHACIACWVAQGVPQ